MRRTLLESLDLPGDLKNLSQVQMCRLAAEVRDLIVEVVSANGGHLAPSLGVVELTIALLSVMDVPEDKIVWDVGHQSYPYKVLTDRRDRFATLRKAGGLSGFPKPSESPYDSFITGHASTAISAALGMAMSRDIAGQRHKVVAIVGDGALGGGMAWEAVNCAGAANADLLVILNDNKMSISPSIGALATHMSRLRSVPLYRSMEHSAEKVFRTIPMGEIIKRVGQGLKRALTNFVSPTSGTIFEALGFDYYGPINGHDIGDLKHFISLSREMKGPVLLHVVTTKGKGYYRAEHKPRRYHGVGPFNSNNGKVSEKSSRTYTDIFGSALVKLAAKNPRVVAITAAMPDGTGLAHFARKFPTRFFDVGIAEEHAVTFAAGLAASGSRPVVAVYSTFMQRAYDQIIHDVCLQNLPVVFALDRAGIVGEDGPTHHGVFDLSFLRHIPNLTVMAPRDAGELACMLYTALKMDSPVALRYPRGAIVGSAKVPLRMIPSGKSETLREGRDLAIIALGPIAREACAAAEELAPAGIEARVISPRYVKPLDETAIVAAARECGGLVLVEENVAQGGFSSAVLECLTRHGVLNTPIEIVALPDSFLGFGKASELRSLYCLTQQGIRSAAERLLSAWASHIRWREKDLSYVRASEGVRRKADHIEIALNEDVEYHRLTAGFERYSFVYEALPEISRGEVDTSVSLLGRRLSMPLVISSMTGGTKEGGIYNRVFAEAAQRFGLAMGVGSQRIALENPDLEETFRVRDVAPDILLFANLGAVQLNNGCDVDSCIRAVEMIDADALILHLNPLQEAAQPGGDTNFRGLAGKIREVCRSVGVPVIAKEVGHGISARTAQLLCEAGVEAIDVAGAGGTSWAKVESYRGAPLGFALGEWGIPTVESLLAVRDAAPATIISSGGVRTGEDIAKSIALGAQAAGMALPLLRTAAISEEALHALIMRLREELAAVMFCTGSRTIEELRMVGLARSC